jgi:hypothetical protein
MAALKAFDPELARQVRARMRKAGDGAIGAMGQILDEDTGGTVAGFARTRGRDSRGRMRNLRGEAIRRDAKRSRSRGSRQQIKKGLRLRVTTGRSRTTVRLTTTSGELRKAMNAKSWRHPVFGRSDTFVEQPGSGYFNRGARAEMDGLRKNLEDAIQIALDAIASNVDNSTD